VSFGPPQERSGWDASLSDVGEDAGRGPLVIGHRGAPGYLPEHTRASFLLAIEQGADAIEVDVVPSRDGVLVVRHERGLGGTTDVGRHREFSSRRRPGPAGRDWFTEDFDWAEIRTLRARERLPRLRPRSAAHDGEEPVLRLAEVAELAAERGVRLVIELKDSVVSARLGLPLPDLLLAELADVDPLPPIDVECFAKTPLLALAERGVGWPLVYLLDAQGIAADEAEARGPGYLEELHRPDLLAARGLGGVSVPLQLVTGDLVERMAIGGLDTWTWTLRPENVFLPLTYRRLGSPASFGYWRPYWRELLASGVRAVFADHPDLAVAIRNEVAPA
jgi:glycerophosphoryl diester phosphodiesterase